MQLIEYPDSATMMRALAERVAGELKAALSENQSASLAVPGGTTPGPMFDALSMADVDWANVNVLLTDERAVPADSDRSNEKLLKSRLLVGRAQAANFVRYIPDDEADMVAMQARVDALGALSVLVLGMGEDMHTASLFPGSPELETALSDDAPSILAVEAPGAPEPRFTLTAPILAKATKKHVLIKGEGKKQALTTALASTTEQAPIGVVLDTATVHWAP
ncbi:MAG: 6-phosphogluconolactonase [Boseongicola sp.]|nr:6-phosphogluconolactonase [Boseongicola sp.]MDD9976557.1 6-phosphogluconolactonase [Boseongicola sp.]